MSFKNHQTLSKEAVFSIFDELLANGTQPTVALVREYFESAPYSAIAGYLSDWINNNDKGEQHKFPPGPDNLSQGLSRLWAQARLLSDEETEQERLDLASYRQAFVKEKQEMLFEIQRLEKENQPQENLRNRFDAERRKLEEQIELLHNELKDVRLKKIEDAVDSHRLEREVLGLEQQNNKLNERLIDNISIVKNLTLENEQLKEQLAKQNATQAENQEALSAANTKIETLQQKIEKQPVPIDPAKIASLQNKINSLEGELSRSNSQLKELVSYKNQQKAKQEALENDLASEKDKNKEAERNYLSAQHELVDLQKTLLQKQLVAGDVKNLEVQVKELTEKMTQYKKVLKDKTARYEKLKKENDALRSTKELQNKLNEAKNIDSAPSPEDKADIVESNFEDEISLLGSKVPDLDIDIDLDEASASKLKDGEKILDLAKEFAVEHK